MPINGYNGEGDKGEVCNQANESRKIKSIPMYHTSSLCRPGTGREGMNSNVVSRKKSSKRLEIMLQVEYHKVGC